jgi:hypothetical protein
LQQRPIRCRERSIPRHSKTFLAVRRCLQSLQSGVSTLCNHSSVGFSKLPTTVSVSSSTPVYINHCQDFINQVLVHINLHRLRANHQQVYINHPRVSWFRLSERTHTPAQLSANAFFPDSAMGATGNGQAGCARASQNGSLLPPAAAAVLHPPHCRRNVD